MNKFICFLLVVSMCSFARADIKCDICDLAVTAAENYLESNKTQAQIQLVLDNLCAKTPFASECTGLVNQYLPQIINLLEQKETPQTICQQLHFCTSNLEFESEFCESVEELHAFLNTTKVDENNVSKFLNSPCERVNSTNKTACHKAMLEVAHLLFGGLHDFEVRHHICEHGITLL